MNRKRTPPLPTDPNHSESDADDTVIGQFRPRITLMTLGRGEGLLGLKPQGKLGPRGDSVTLAQFDWTYQTDAGDRWHTPAPTSILNSRPPAVQELFDTGGPVVRLQRDLAAEAERDKLRAQEAALLARIAAVREALHGPDRVAACPECGRAFGGPRPLSVHRAKAHGVRSPKPSRQAVSA